MADTLFLPCTLTGPERLSLALELSTAVDAARAKEDEKKAAMVKFTEEINALYAKIYDLNAPVKTGVIEREIEVDFRRDEFRKKIETWRLDLNEFVSERDMKESELQMPLGTASSKAKRRKKFEFKTEEQLADSPEEAEEIRAKRIGDENRDRARALVLEAAPNVIVLPNDSDNPADAFKASIGPHDGFPWADIVESFGATEQEAREALVDKCVRLILNAAEDDARALREKILDTFGKVFEMRSTEQLESGRFVARIAAEGWAIETDGADLAEAESRLRADLLALVERKARAEEAIDQLMAASTVEMRGSEGYIATVPAAPGLASGLAGPIRATPEEAVAELRSELARLLAGTAPVEQTPDEVARAIELEKLEAEQQADAAKDGPKKGLQVPKGAKGRRTKPAKEEANGVDTDPPPAPDGGEPLGF